MSKGSERASLSSIPSVIYRSLVSALEQSSNLTQYPTCIKRTKGALMLNQVYFLPHLLTSFPSSVPLSSATLLAMLMAATLRGCVTAIVPFLGRPASRRYWRGGEGVHEWHMCMRYVGRSVCV